MDPIQLLRDRCATAGQARVATELAISRQYLNDLLQGLRRPGPKILQALDLERVVTYRKRSRKC